MALEIVESIYDKTAKKTAYRGDYMHFIDNFLVTNGVAR